MRNIINHQEIELVLSKLKSTYEGQELMMAFINQNVKNYIISSFPIRENKTFTANFPGPYHEVILEDQEWNDRLTRVCDNVFLKIFKKELNSLYQVSSFSVDNFFSNSMKWVSYGKGYNCFQIMNSEELVKVGEKLNNCLKNSSVYFHMLHKNVAAYYVLKDEEMVDWMVGYVVEGLIRELKLDLNTTPSPAQLDVFLSLVSNVKPMPPTEFVERQAFRVVNIKLDYLNLFNLAILIGICNSSISLFDLSLAWGVVPAILSLLFTWVVISSQDTSSFNVLKKLKLHKVFFE